MAVSFGVKVRGFKQARNKLGRFTSKLENDPKETFLEEAVRMEAEAKMLVPVESGDLRNSISANVIQKGLSVSLDMSASSVHNGYDYSAKQHNDVTLKHPNGGEPFFIAKPFAAGVDRIYKRLNREIRYD